jgi:hypothetical protein
MFFFVPYGIANSNNLATWDHNHHSQKDRRLIDTGCNKGLGCFKDNPAIVARAVVYLQSEGNYATGTENVPCL